MWWIFFNGMLGWIEVADGLLVMYAHLFFVVWKKMEEVGKWIDKETILRFNCQPPIKL